MPKAPYICPLTEGKDIVNGAVAEFLAKVFVNGIWATIHILTLCFENSVRTEHLWFLLTFVYMKRKLCILVQQLYGTNY